MFTIYCKANKGKRESRGRKAGGGKTGMNYKGYKIKRSPFYCIAGKDGRFLPDAQDIKEAKWLINEAIKQTKEQAVEKQGGEK